MIRATANELRSIARAAEDASGYFPALYATVTDRIAEGVEGGTFRAGGSMAVFATTFARCYTEAQRERTGAPACWRACWDVAGDRDLLIVQHLLLGINAHVNYDLPRAVVRLADETGDLAGIRPDFDTVNDVLAETFPDVLRDLDRVSRWVNAAARLGGERSFNFSLRIARQRAWAAAERMHALDGAGRAAYEAELDRLVSVLAYLITRPGFPASLVVRLARRLEEKDPRKVIAALL